jgi:ABC-type iron transport system FetAB permease component
VWVPSVTRSRPSSVADATASQPPHAVLADAFEADGRGMVVVSKLQWWAPATVIPLTDISCNDSENLSVLPVGERTISMGSGPHLRATVALSGLSIMARVPAARRSPTAVLLRICTEPHGEVASYRSIVVAR